MEVINRRYWQNPPTRDEVLEQAYSFITLIAADNVQGAQHLVVDTDIAALRVGLGQALQVFLKEVVEDEALEQYAHRDLASLLTNPQQVDEVVSRPEFNGNSYNLVADETFSFHLAMLRQVLGLRICFRLVEHDALYFLRVEQLIRNRV